MIQILLNLLDFYLYLLSLVLKQLHHIQVTLLGLSYTTNVKIWRKYLIFLLTIRLLDLFVGFTFVLSYILVFPIE
jgi:hypothetical protein